MISTSDSELTLTYTYHPPCPLLRLSLCRACFPATALSFPVRVRFAVCHCLPRPSILISWSRTISSGDPAKLVYSSSHQNIRFAPTNAWAAVPPHAPPSASGGHESSHAWSSRAIAETAVGSLAGVVFASLACYPLCRRRIKRRSLDVMLLEGVALPVLHQMGASTPRPS